MLFGRYFSVVYFLAISIPPFLDFCKVRKEHSIEVTNLALVSKAAWLSETNLSVQNFFFFLSHRVVIVIVGVVVGVAYPRRERSSQYETAQTI